MRDSLLGWLRCELCGAALGLERAEREDGEVRSGTLACSACPRRVPVMDFIPRFVTEDDYARSFSSEWHWFRQVQIDAANRNEESDSDLRWMTGWTPEDLRGRSVLDVGVGAGRYGDVASCWGAEVVGVDLSFAVDAARRNLAGRDAVHFVQADLFALPLVPGSFDFVFSMGVLHHTPDTRRAFEEISRFVRPGGQLAIFVYAHGHYHYLSDMWRRFTTRLPRRLMYYLSWVAVPLYWVHKLPVLGKLAQFALPTANWPDWRWRWLDTFDWYTPRFQWKHTWPEVFGWFRDGGFTDIELFEEDHESSLQLICMRGRKATQATGRSLVPRSAHRPRTSSQDPAK